MIRLFMSGVKHVQLTRMAAWFSKRKHEQNARQSFAWFCLKDISFVFNATALIAQARPRPGIPTGLMMKCHCPEGAQYQHCIAPLPDLQHFEPGGSQTRY
ncbi:MAG: hypothetical protein ACKV2V_13290 [Blastocatellia bacterium]